VAIERPDSVSLFRRCKSARRSTALWWRRLRSFCKHLQTIRSSSAGRSGFSRTGGAGVRLRIESKIVAVLSPRNGNCPVPISYKTVPPENLEISERMWLILPS